jgi:hypothetical protein
MHQSCAASLEVAHRPQVLNRQPEAANSILLGIFFLCRLYLVLQRGSATDDSSRQRQRDLHLRIRLQINVRHFRDLAHACESIHVLDDYRRPLLADLPRRR